MPSVISAGTTAGTAIAIAGDTTGNLAFQTNGTTTAMTIDTSQRVGIGTSSPTRILDVAGPAGSGGGEQGVRLTDTTSGNVVQLIRTGATYSYNGIGGNEGVCYSSNVLTLSADNNNVIKFALAGSERMRIDNTGNLLINTTTANNPTLSQGFLTVNQTGLKNGMVARINQSGYTALAVEPVGHNSWFFGYMLNSSGAVIGSIACNATSTSYVTSSDYRLKENIAPMTGALAKVQSLKPVTYTWKNTSEQADGFIAHELAEICPQAVTGEKDAVNEEGKPVYQGIDTSFLVATLTAAIQELKAELDATKAEVAALKGVA